MKKNQPAGSFLFKDAFWKIFLFMKLTVILLMCFSLQVTAKVHSQTKVTLKMQQVSLSKIFLAIERKTDFRFLFNDDLLPGDEKIDINVKDEFVTRVLDRLLNNTSLGYKIVQDNLIVITNSLSVSSATEVSGVVNNSKGEPIANASVLEKGTSNGTTTSNNGVFRLSVASPNAVILVSYIGYESQEIPLKGLSTITIQLKVKNSQLDDVVVIGYGTQRKRDLTGAVAQIKAEDIRGFAVTGFDQAIQGKVAGVTVVNNSGEPGGNVSIKIRGVGSINGNSDPLYIIDGIPSEGGLNAINPNDIETIDVMKDASAAAIYGSRASNGVVIITTRRGKVGKFQIDLDAYTGTQSMSKQLKLLNTTQLFSLAKEAITNQQKDPRYSSTPVALAGPNPVWEDPSKWVNTDWQDEISQKGSIQSYNVSMLGGSQNFRSSTMMGYYKMNGILLNSFYERFSVRSNNNYDIKKWLRGGFTIAVSKERGNTINSDRIENASISALQLATRAVPYLPVNAPDGYGTGTPGSLFYGFNGYAFLGRRTTSDAIGQFYYPGNLFNPAYNLSSSIQNPSNTWRLLGGTYMEIEPIAGLKLRSTINVDYNTNRGFYGEVPVNAETNIGQQDGIAYFGDNQNYTWNWVNTLGYDKKIGNHRFAMLVGTDVLKFVGNRTSITGAGYSAGEKFVPDNANQRTASSYEIANSLLSYLGRVTYDYAGKYLMAFNIRRDGSSRFGPLNRYGTFPSASVGWQVSEESFMKNITFISGLKLRGSYGILGNQKIPDFRFISTYSPRDNVGYAFFPIRYPLGPASAGYQATQNGVALSNLANEAIQWESSSQLDFGMDASFFNNRLTLTVDYYKKKLYDLLGNEPVPITFGSPSGSRFGNFASLENTGWEFTVGIKESIGKVNFSAELNAAITSNKVTDIGNSSDISSGFGLLGFASTRTIVGQPIAQFYGYVTDGIYQNKAEIDKGPTMPLTVVPGDRRFKDISGLEGKPDGKINEFDRTYLGSGFPKWVGGINLRAEWKGFDVNLFLNGQAGSKVAADWMNYSHNIRNYNGGGFQNASIDMLNRWQKEGDQTDIPRLSYDQAASNSWFSDFYVRKNDFIRLRNLQVGYTIPATTISRLGISRARVYVSAQNLLTITGYNGFDPEIGVRRDDAFGGNQVLLTGVDSGRYPTARTFTAGVNVSF
ncbi:MAG: TonB-dependent receptor [Ferruginibacter sp.]|nr:TonB-dependent receptor [Ferruginibacter sp.]